MLSGIYAKISYEDEPYEKLPSRQFLLLYRAMIIFHYVGKLIQISNFLMKLTSIQVHNTEWQKRDEIFFLFALNQWQGGVFKK